MRFLLAIVSALVLAGPATAQSLFTIDTDIFGISGRGDDLVSLIDDLLSQTGEFSGLAPQATYTASLDYLGIPNAVNLALTNNGNDLVLTIPSTGAVVVFNGTSPSDVENRVEDWLKETGVNAWSKFLREANGLAPLALLDGNPRATTALMANSAYRRFGLHDQRSRLGYMEQEVTRFGTFGVTLEVGGGSVSTDQFDGLNSIDGSLEVSGEFNDTVGLAFSIVGQYRDYRSAELYDIGIELGVPIRLERPVDGENLYWGVTPVLQVGAGVSPDFAAGGLFMGGGLVNSVALQLGIIELGMGNELIYYGGIPLNDISGYDFDTKLSQLMMKNGLRVAIRPISLLYAEAGLSITNFLLDYSALNYYATPFIGGGIRLGRFVELRASYEVDLGENDYRGHRGRMELAAYF